MKKLFISLSCLLFMDLIYGSMPAVYANNTSYIALSNQIARKRQLDVVANNVANAMTTGYEQDDILFRKVENRQNPHRTNSFVWAETTYKSGEHGALKFTNRPTDVAIAGRGFFKVITPRGERYTLDGSMIINNQSIMVNSEGYPYSNVDGDVIQIPDNYQALDISEDGSIYVDNEQIDTIGVFDFAVDDPFIKEGNKLYKASGDGVLLDDFKIISGALRQSNVSSVVAMAKMVEMQRSVGTTNNLMSDISELERTIISKIPK